MTKTYRTQTREIRWSLSRVYMVSKASVFPRQQVSIQAWGLKAQPQAKREEDEEAAPEARGAAGRASKKGYGGPLNPPESSKHYILKPLWHSLLTTTTKPKVLSCKHYLSIQRCMKLTTCFRKFMLRVGTRTRLSVQLGTELTLDPEILRCGQRSHA